MKTPPVVISWNQPRGAPKTPGPLPAHLVDCEVTTEHNGFELDNKRISPDAMDAFMRNEQLGGCKRWVPTKTPAISQRKK